ncbi:alkaline phosphatase family protein [Devosia sp.]|uniref:alkaline phosphatase family protein n=1 Tax=Devosia sp. TaxID=1871048 RepID=UPI00326472CA
MKSVRHILTAALLSTAFFSSIIGNSYAGAPYAHVMLISIDGMHAIDLANYVATHQTSTLAALAKTAVQYPNALSPAPSDSFPGMLALVTGGTPRSTGVFYDDSYDRTYFAPGSDCSGAPGAEVTLAENIDVDSTKLNAGGTPGQWRTQIDVAKLPMTLVGGKCVAVYPHQFSRVNNAFEIVKAHGGRTAWSDKHPAYELLNGPSGTGLDDFYALEQDSLIDGSDKATTKSFKSERDFDAARVKVLLNQIQGMDSTGTSKAAVPQLFGMNFQAVSVGQKLPKSGPGDDAGLIGGYSDASGTPNNALAAQLDYVDGALGELVDALKAQNLLDSTLVIVTAKHGQAPIDPASLRSLDDAPYAKIPGYAFHIADDASLIWLDSTTRSANVQAASAYLDANAETLGIGKIWTPNQMALAYNDPANDSRTPDFMVTVNPGVVYTSGSKIAEHGGANLDDRNVLLLISNPGITRKTSTALVQTAQVAPTILNALGLDPKELQAVQQEGTTELPLLPF